MGVLDEDGWKCVCFNGDLYMYFDESSDTCADEIDGVDDHGFQYVMIGIRGA